MGHVFTYNDAKIYERWLTAPRNQAMMAAENRLMTCMLNPMRGETVLDVGCGTGIRFLPLLDKRLHVTGLDASPHMLETAEKLVSNRVDLHRGAAEDLPFDDNSFSYATIIHTLEFVEDPRKTLEEVFRVTKDRVFIGILNRHSMRTAGWRIERIFTHDMYHHARFFTLWEIRRMIRSLAGDVPMNWQTICRIPNPIGWLPKRSGRWHVPCKSPVGPFTGISVTLTPRFNTRPMLLKCSGKRLSGSLTSLARNKLLDAA